MSQLPFLSCASLRGFVLKQGKLLGKQIRPDWPAPKRGIWLVEFLKITPPRGDVFVATIATSSLRQHSVCGTVMAQR